MCWHKWGKWQTLETGEVISGKSKAVVGFYIVQKKTCEKCGKSKIKTEETL